LNRSTPLAGEMPEKIGVSVTRGFIAALVLLSSGCRGAAYRDVYTQKMTSEIRNLEDQLYDADYQNQVLRDELMRAEMRAAQVVVPQAARPPRSFFGKTLNQDGEVVDLRTNRSPKPMPIPKAESPERMTPKLPARPLDNTESFEPPSEPVPPGSIDLLIPDVELGDPVPPMNELPDSLPEFQPGQIKLPDSAKILGNGPPPAPVAIRINNGLSGGHKSDDVAATEGVELLIEAIDESGKVVDLSQFNIDANLSIVLLDPARSADTARLGKWDFGPEQIHEMLSSNPASPIHQGRLQVVIPWGEERPASTTVMAHVRLSADEIVMQTQGEIATNHAMAANWTPRASTKR